ncbi:MAG: tyrosine-protein phosphatase [Lancefieldella rimae]|uniref:Tyrosine-protein phosphatase n=1 Tax=Lancefieldella rimae TaxID=1383 RepID=A0A930YRR2_9ACTN|nr:tyrosine-protein phosphatase [Lancefieldella rimae]
MKRLLSILLSLVLSFMLVGCGGAAPSQQQQQQQTTQQSTSEQKTTGALAVIHEKKFGGVYLDITIDEFNALGFEYGDSCDVTFSNGYKLEDIPYYNGYYSKTGHPLISAYPGFPHIDVCVNNGDPLWETAGLKEGDTGTVTLREKGKYLTTQQALAAVYTTDRNDYPSDEAFANFRAMKGGQIAENMVYRSASPCNNEYGRAAYASALAEKAGVQFILDQADSTEEVEGYYTDPSFDMSWHKGLFDNGHVAALDMNVNYRSQKFAGKLVEGLRQMIAQDGPYLIHCTEGKDRTGFTCALLEALCGASYDEMLDDYMISYDNYYGINKQTDKDRYDAVVDAKFNDIALCIGGQPVDGKLDGLDYKAGARKYLLDAGMTEEEITQLENKLCGK